MLAVAVVALLSCRSEQVEAPGTAASPPGEPSTVDVDAGAAASAGSSAPRLTADGWADLRIGMTRDEVVAVAGQDADPAAVGGPEPDRCDEFHPSTSPAGMRVMIERDRLTRISLAREADVETDEGLAVGDSAAAVRAAYGGRAVTTPHKYVASPAAYVTVWKTPPPDTAARGIVYEIGLDGRVEQIHAGSASIGYVEGCL